MFLAETSVQFDEDGHLKGDLYIKTLTDLMASLRAEIGRG